MRWGAEPLPNGTTRFRLWAPGTDAVAIEIANAATTPKLHSGEGPELAEEARTSLTPTDDGWWEITLPAPPGTRYRYRIGDTAVPDPASRRQDGGVHGWSIVPDDGYGWRTPDWRGRAWHKMVFMELHAGTLGGFAGITQRLPAIAALGVTAIQLMPINAFAGTRGWGYDGVLPYAVHEAYGTPDDLRALIDAAHELGLSVFLDVVYNHFGPDGNYLGLYADRFFHRDVATPWGGAVAVDEPAVARFFIGNALMWLHDYRFDGLRFDAVHAIDNPAFLDTMAAEIRAALPDRHVHLVLENEANDAARLRPDAYDAQWNDDFHNVLHVLLTSETSAYYGDFADRPAERLARCLADGFIYQGDPSPNHDGKPRGTPSGHLSPTGFVSFLQNHDQVGNRAMGERLTRLTDPAKLRAATALMLLAPQIPLLFMGEEEGSDTPFLFFTDFHDDLADAVREGRRKEFAKFAAFADEQARARIPDPNAKSTFTASIPQPGPDAPTWRALYQHLLRLRREQIVPHLADTATLPVSDGATDDLPRIRSLSAQATGDARVTAHWRLRGGKILTIVIDLADTPAPLPAAPLMVSEAEARSADERTGILPAENGTAAGPIPLFTTDDRFVAWIE